MPNIKSKRSAIPGRVPTIDQLQLGELALNTYDGRLFLKKSAGGVESIVTLKAQENATFSRLTAGYGLQDGVYDGTSDVVFNSFNNSFSPFLPQVLQSPLNFFLNFSPATKAVSDVLCLLTVP
jgi:hypothetical protein